MTAYKFLTKDGIGPISGYRWPMPVGHANGAWVETLGPLALCERGIHLCSAFDLAHWLHDDLWEVESDGEHIEGIDCIIVRRARLVRRIDAWSNGGAARFAEACIEHSTSLAGSASSTAVRGCRLYRHQCILCGPRGLQGRRCDRHGGRLSSRAPLASRLDR
jgi:hypothetical protein